MTMSPLTIIFLAAAAILFVISLVLVNAGKVSPLRRGGDQFMRHRKRRQLGLILLAPAFILAGVGYFHQTNTKALDDPEGRIDDMTDVPSAFPLQHSYIVPPTPGLVNGVDLDEDQKKLDDFLAKNPKSAVAHGDRGNIYAAKGDYAEAEKEYRTALSIDPTRLKAAFNLAEMEFRQKHYDAARTGFAALQEDTYLGELSRYKVFLCDLLGGHEQIAADELAVLDKAGTGPAYYFAHIAWSVAHGKPEDARHWLSSANHIYEPYKLELFSASLRDLGYLPLPPATAT